MAHPGGTGTSGTGPAEPAVPDTNAAVWKSPQIVETWTAGAERRERLSAFPLRLVALLLPFAEDEAFTFLDLGAGTGAASRAVLSAFPRANAILADYSEEMMGQGAVEMRPFSGRYRYVAFDMVAGEWPDLPVPLAAVVSSLCVHHLPDERKRTLFVEVAERLVPGGWYLNFDPVTSEDDAVDAAWQRANDRLDPEAAYQRHHRTEAEQAHYENHVRYMVPLERQLGYLRAAGFAAVDVYWKRLDHVVYGGCRPS